jgi:hypothetical protein
LSANRYIWSAPKREGTKREGARALGSGTITAFLTCEAEEKSQHLISENKEISIGHFLFGTDIATFNF